MKCTQCGNELASGARFCNHCGAPVIRWTEDTMEKVTEEKTDEMVPSGASQVKKRTAWKDSYTILLICVAVIAAALIGLGVKRQMKSNGEVMTAGTGVDVMETISEEEINLGEENVNVGPDENMTGYLMAEENDEVTEEMISSIETVSEENEAEYILPGSDTRYIREEELEGLSAEQCRLARNELYARHGRKFDDEELQNYFEQFDWYVPSIEPEDFSEESLNEYELANRDLIVKYEEEQGYR